MNNQEQVRRRFLKYLAASPVFASPLGMGAVGALLPGQILGQIVEDEDFIPDSAEAAVNIFDMERAAHSSLSRAHWTYLSQGVEDEVTLVPVIPLDILGSHYGASPQGGGGRVSSSLPDGRCACTESGSDATL